MKWTQNAYQANKPKGFSNFKASIYLVAYFHSQVKEKALDSKPGQAQAQLAAK